MGKINEQHLLDEIRFDIKVKDLLKGKLVLAELGQVSRAAQKQALEEVMTADDSFAIPLLVGFIAGHQDLAAKFPHVKDAMFAKILGHPEIFLQILGQTTDPAPKRMLIEIAGEIRFRKSVPLLLDLLQKETDVTIIEAVISSLGMLADPSAVSAISEHLYSPAKEVVLASINALGEMATPEALQKLLDRLGGETDIDLMIINLIARIQTPAAIEKLNHILSSKFVHLRIAAKKKLGEIGVMSVRVLTRNLLQNNPDLIIHSLNVLGDLGDSAAIPPIRKLLFNQPKDPNIRFAAYEALGRLPLAKNAFALALGLEDEVDNVRDAAAKAIDQNYNPVLGGGVRNLILSDHALALKTVSSIINAQCGHIFLDLIEEEYFKVPALKYLSGQAHTGIKSFFARLLLRAGFSDLAREISLDPQVPTRGGFKVFAVDDSRMILSIYRVVLHNLGCDAQLYEFPASALEHLQTAKPDIIFTDLNMPDISGLDLSRSVRKKFSKDKLPIVMVTTQGEERSDQEAYEAGVNVIMKKPFSEGQIKKILEQISRQFKTKPAPIS